ISHRSEKVSIPRTIVADTAWLALLLASLVCTDPSFSSNRPDQLKHAYDYILMRVLTQSLHQTHTEQIPRDPNSSNTSPVAQSFSSNSLFFLETLY
ncbi:unnamed protein product, partial [Hymenolepis diminuta]